VYKRQRMIRSKTLSILQQASMLSYILSAASGSKV